MNAMETIHYDFSAGQARARALSNKELLGAIRDLRETIDVQEASNRQGGHTPKLGYYWDEYHTYVAENKRRGEERRKQRRQKFFLLSPSHTRQYTLNSIRRQRPHWDCDRVSIDGMLKFEEHLKEMIDRAVRRHRSGIKTFTDFL